MKQFITKYWIGNSFYSSDIIASDWDEAQEIANKRGIGEVVYGENDKIENHKINTLQELTHFCTFLSFIALKSKRASIEQILGDTGVLHELIHFSSNSYNDDTKELIYEKVKWLFEITETPIPENLYDILNQ